jgi:hypothetical protein
LYGAFAVKFSQNEKANKWINTIIQGTCLWVHNPIKLT